jgi:hypothetical protein
MACGKYGKGRPMAKKGTAGKAKSMNKARRVTGVAKKGKK